MMPMIAMMKAIISMSVKGNSVEEIWSQVRFIDPNEKRKIKFKKSIMPQIPTPKMMSALFMFLSPCD